jgi:hypothetical protein
MRMRLIIICKGYGGRGCTPLTYAKGGAKASPLSQLVVTSNYVCKSIYNLPMEQVIYPIHDKPDGICNYHEYCNSPTQ